MTNKMFDNSDLLCIFIAIIHAMMKLDYNIVNIAGDGKLPLGDSWREFLLRGFYLLPA